MAYKSTDDAERDITGGEVLSLGGGEGESIGDISPSSGSVARPAVAEVSIVK